MATYEPKWDNYYRAIERLPRRFREIAQFVVDAISIFKDHEFYHTLDMGCGAGRHSIYLANEGFDVIGIDISRSALRIAEKWRQQEKLRNIALIRAAMTHLPFKDCCFDGEISVSAIHHAISKDIEATIGEIHRILKKGGLILANLTSVEDPRLGTGKRVEENTFLILEAFEQNQFEELHHFFTKNEVLELFARFAETNVNSFKERPKYLKVMAKK
jgi:ubiquinone/menaquinone biosynthesis C-methylase UbiE